MEIAVAYIRVSREDENPENQRYIIENYCREHDLNCIFFPPEIGVARTEDPFQRPVFRQLLDFMDLNKIRVLVVESIDRLVAEPEYWDNLISYITEHGIRLVAVRDIDVTDAFEKAITILEGLRNRVDSAVFREVLMQQVEQLKLQIKYYQRLKVAVAKEYVEDIRYKVKRAMRRLREEGRVYTKPTFIHWLALFMTGKNSFAELSRNDIERAKQVFIERYVKPYLDGIPVRRLYRKFVEQEKPVIEMIRRYRESKIAAIQLVRKQSPRRREIYASYTSFYRLVKRLSRETHSSATFANSSKSTSINLL